MKMKLKTIEVDGNTYAELKDGQPVYIDDNGKQQTYDAPAMHAIIGKLNKEAQGHREAKEALEARVTAFGDLDPAEARKALTTLKNIDQKKLIDADKVAQIKQEAIQPIQDQLNAALKEKDALTNQYATAQINASFAGSKFVKDNLAIPADMVQAAFARNFEWKDGVVVAKDGNGLPILNNSGAPASFDEALEKIVDQYPNKDAIMKGAGHSGSGAQPPNGSGKSTMKRATFESLPGHERQKYAASVAKGEVTLVD